MHKLASYNHRIFPATDIKISAISPAGLYGKGVFTTLAVYDSQPFLWEKHWRRLSLHADKLGIELTEYTEEKVVDSLAEIIRRNKIKNGRCRLTFFDESESSIWKTENSGQTSLLIQSADLREMTENVTIGVSPYSVNSKCPLAGLKSCNYLENLLALEEARSRNFYEAVRYDQRNVVSSFCMANIFWLENGSSKLFTPGLNTGCLAGTTRELIMERYQVVEVEKEINEFFRDAETVFMTSAGIGIVQVSGFDELRFNTDRHKLTDLIQSEINSVSLRRRN